MTVEEARTDYAECLEHVSTRDEIPHVLNSRRLFGCGVEVGVQQGIFSAHLLANWRGAHLISVDPWIEQAKKELAAAGVIAPGEDIPEITLDLGGRDELTRRIAEFVKGEFRKVGVRVKVELNDWPTLLGKINNKRFQTCTLGWHADYPDAENFLQNFYSPNIDLNTNYVGYVNKDFDRLFEESSKYPEVEKRVPLYAEMAKMIAEDVPVMLLAEPVTYTLMMPWTGNFKYHPIAYGLGKYTRIDLDARVKAGGRP